MLIAGATAKSWYTVSMPARRASMGDLKWMGVPSKPFVGHRGSRQAFDERGLACTVVANDGQNFASAQLKVGTV
jgi:hypothetical protein